MFSQRNYREQISHDIAVAYVGLFVLCAYVIQHQRSLRNGVRLLQNAAQTSEFQTVLEVLATNLLPVFPAFLFCGAVLAQVCLSLRLDKWVTLLNQNTE